MSFEIVSFNTLENLLHKYRYSQVLVRLTTFRVPFNSLKEYKSVERVIKLKTNYFFVSTIV